MRDIYVDIGGLSQVHRNLVRIRHDLQDFDTSWSEAQSDAMGHDRVIGAFNDFVHGWRDGRERIDLQIEVASSKIEAAVEAYTRAETEIGGMADDMRGGLQ